MVNLCPYCGAVEPQPKLFKSKIQQRIFDFIRAHAGCDLNQITDYVYQEDPNGGPETLNVLSVHIHKMKPILRQWGMEILTQTGRGGGNYRIVKLEQAK